MDKLTDKELEEVNGGGIKTFPAMHFVCKCKNYKNEEFLEKSTDFNNSLAFVMVQKSFEKSLKSKGYTILEWTTEQA